MVYGIRPLRLSMISMIFVPLLWSVLVQYYGWSFSTFFSVLFIVVALGSIRFKLEINDNHLVYEVFILFKISIIKKEIHPSEVAHLKFTRVGWAKKAAILKTNKGSNIRLVVLEPPEAYEHLMEFAVKHDLDIVKTKDYLILERYYKD
ncbi:hypothetical protein [Alkalihalobacterium chitinilyticum]|uniref:DUF58 domain-containing protein n=1 Tax=Alkalihalobacterium chitinilyticum TaxID=2980103 RepID=A0ABT5VLD8_9BACI|nr:hypothetical protein [Alkalihalobacterium chitinilyticum]MDE5416041.1 hypothetical protein [Alkalihalobacterium chitinilyticum]